MAATEISASQEEVKAEKNESQLSTMDKFKKFVTPNRHTKIESFGRRVLILGGTFGVMMATTGFLTYEHSQQHLSQQALYSTEFKTSKTNQPGTVDGVYTNRDNSRVLVMMTFSDPSRMSGLASNYQAYLAGADTNQSVTDIKSHPSGSIIMFGQGHMGLYLTNNGGFHQQIVSAILRANKQLVSTADQDSMSDDTYTRKSFNIYDQWQVYFNPAGKSATHIKSLDDQKLNIGKVYYDTVLKKQEATQRSTLNDDLVTLKADLATIQDYKTRLQTTSVNGLHVKLPADPEMVAGDEVTGSDASPGKPSTLELKPNKVFNNGFNFDWRSASLEKGIIQNIAPKNQNYVTWMNNHLAQQTQSDPSTSLQWKLSDGTDLSSVSTSDIVSFQNLNSMVQSLTSAYSQYYTDKEKYQSDDLGQFLSLDLQLKDVVQNNTINTSKNVIGFYR